MKLLLILFFCVTIFPILDAQNYTAYSLGNNTDALGTAQGGICLMGGATEDDNAILWFLQRAGGGDVLVLRASGSDGYNSYFYNMSGVSINSVTTIVCHNAMVSSDSFLLQKIEKAEAIWFAGGDQWDYVNYWRGTAIDSLINKGIQDRHIVIGGTSAGMAIQGGYYFSAQNGTVTSATALSNPYANSVTVDSMAFIQNAYLSDVITDTHYDNPDRRGRQSVFLARILTDYGINAKGIACEEYTAVCIDTNGIAKVFGDYPNYDDKAYFIQTNCSLSSYTPENCSSGQALTWDRDSAALVVCTINGTSTGSNFIDLKDWKTTSGSDWEHWSVQNGVFQAQPTDSINCSFPTFNRPITSTPIETFPNPVFDQLQIYLPLEWAATEIDLYHISGFLLRSYDVRSKLDYKISMLDHADGSYLIVIRKNQAILSQKMIIKISH